ncbi:hypothetical protein GOODEAATRI_009108 [Goodea atripinnis]|uniref:Uncharacterized protein n=1 Tax=Goodea atripinnis TaxID=208336 RepID=A0ABV0PM21_9TELE
MFPNSQTFHPCMRWRTEAAFISASFLAVLSNMIVEIPLEFLKKFCAVVLHSDLLCRTMTGVSAFYGILFVRQLGLNIEKNNYHAVASCFEKILRFYSYCTVEP